MKSMARLYEQEREEPFGSPQFGLYVLVWMRWIREIASDNTTCMQLFPQWSAGYQSEAGLLPRVKVQGQ